MEKKWEEMSADERREELFSRFLSPEGVAFVSPESEMAYKERATRIKDAIDMKKPDRVPIFPFVGLFPALYARLTPQEVMYDYDKCCMIFKKYIKDFEPDAHPGTFIVVPGKLHEILDYKLYVWPGHGVSPEHTYQCIEGEYMLADEYDALIRDPSNYFMTTYLPRVFGAFEPFKMLTPLTNILEMYAGFTSASFIAYGLPPVQDALKALMEAGNEALKWIGAVGPCHKEMDAAGFPNFFGGGCKVPFDTLGDTLRGTRGIMMDMYRQPAKLLEALEAMTPIMIKMGASAAKMNGNPIVFIPLHKGADGFLSDEQYKRFYWPTFKKLLMGLIEEGCVPFPWAEGGYNSRLEVIRDVPKGKVLYGFDMTDMAKAKEILSDVACIGGNMPMPLLSVGTPDQVKDYTKKLIDTCGEGGGYIMINGVVIDEAKPENVKTWIDATKEYGVYK